MSVFDSVRNSIAFIEAHLHQNLGVSDVARAVSYSQFYLSREFSRHTHLSLYDYIMRRKLTEACKLLLKGTSRIVDVAVDFGFQSHEVFTRAFRKAFGVNPSEAATACALAFFEPINEDYLAFLKDLKAEALHQPADACYFQVGAQTPPDDSDSLLVLLDEDGRSIQSLLTGKVMSTESQFLSFKLTHLCHAVRIHGTGKKYALRYFTDHFFNPTALTSNFILLRQEQDVIDILMPA